MKKTILICLILLSINSFSQSFPKNNPEILLGKTVTPKEFSEIEQTYHYKNFYESFDKKKQEFGKNIYAKSRYSIQSDYSKLVGLLFEVKNVSKVNSKYSDLFNEYVIELYNEKLGTVYYKYENKDYSYELTVIGGLEFPEDFFCDEIVFKEDKFDNSKTWTSSVNGGIGFMKTEVNGSVSIFMNVQKYSSNLSSVNGKGLILLFKNGKRIELKDEKIEVEVDRTSYVYSAFIKLNNEQIKLLSEDLITDTRLYIHDSEIDIDNAYVIQGIIKCLNKN